MCSIQYMAHSKYSRAICHHYYVYVPNIYDTQQMYIDTGGEEITVTGS